MKSRLLFTLLSSFLFLGMGWNTTYAQSNGDSLLSIWNNEQLAPEIRMESVHSHIWNIVFATPDSALTLSNKLLELAKNENNTRWQGEAYNSLAVAEYMQGNVQLFIEYNQTGLKMARANSDTLIMGKCISDLGNYYSNIGDYMTAYRYYQEGLIFNRAANNKKGESYNIGNLGNIFKNLGDYKKAEKYYKAQLLINEKLQDPQTATAATSNLGNMYMLMGDSLKAVEFIKKGMILAEEGGFKMFSAGGHSSLFDYYINVNDLDKAEYHLNAMGDIRDELNSPILIALCEGASCYLKHKLKDDNSTLSTCENALKLATGPMAHGLKMAILNALYEINKSNGNGNEALAYHEQLTTLKDSLNNDKAKTDIQHEEFKKQMLIDSLAMVEEARIVHEAHQEEVQKKNQTRNMFAGGGLIALLLAGGIYSRLRYMRKSKAIIEEEKDRSNNLLLNILPADIAEELKIHGKAEARDFDMVSILFTDFKGFTKASAKMSAADLVNEINHCFEAFDGIMGKYNIEKIKTIGDAYMAAGGLPVPTDDSIKNTVLAALEMQDFIGKRKAENDAKNKPAFEMRVGIHTGPVVAGIVGVKKFQYDIWGDTVNTASRIESNGEAGKVNISQATYEFLKEDSSFSFQSRGKIEAKGKGEMEMYFVAKAY